MNEKVETKPKVKSVFNGDIWKNKKYVIWAIAIPLALFGYFVPYVHIVIKPTLITEFLTDNNFPR